MSNKKKHSATPARTVQKSTSPRLNKAKDARDTRKFFLVLAVGTLLLVFFMYLIFMAANR